MQTSIEWLIEQLVEMDKQLDGRRKNEDATILKMNPTKIFEEAKEMHKQEIIKSYRDGRLDEELSDRRSKHFNKVAIGYYLETFKKD